MARCRLRLLLIFICFVAVAFSCSAILPSIFSVRATTFEDTLERFEALPLDSAEPNFDGSITLATKAVSGDSVDFNLYAVDSDNMRSAIFSRSDMEYIADKVRINDMEFLADPAFVIVDDTDDAQGANSGVVFELLHLDTAPGQGGTIQRITHKSASGAITGILPISSSETARPPRQTMRVDDSFSLRAFLYEEGHYLFEFSVLTAGITGSEPRNLRFEFYLVHASKYEVHSGASTDKNENAGATTFDATKVGFLSLQNAEKLPLEKNNPTDPQEYSYYKYFYHYETSAPRIAYDTSRFLAEVWFTPYLGIRHKLAMPTTGIADKVFTEDGDYEFKFLLGYYFEGEFIVASNYAKYEFTLDIYGLRAKYADLTSLDGGYKLFGGEEIVVKGVSYPVEADISGVITDTQVRDDLDNYTNTTATINTLKDSLPEHQVAITNMLRVKLTGDAEIVGDYSRYMFKPYGSSKWQPRQFENNGYYEEAGEYLVLVYYRYAPSGSNDLKWQLFHFVIEDTLESIGVSVFDDYTDSGSVNGDVMVTEYSFAKLFASDKYISPFMIVSFGGMFNRGPYVRTPEFELDFVDFTGKHGTGFPKQFDADTISFGGEIFSREGIYTFTFYFGVANTSAEKREFKQFSLVLDKSPFTNFVAKSTYVDDHDVVNTIVAGSGDAGNYVVMDGDTPLTNVAVFKGDNVSLEWGIKDSTVFGVDIADVSQLHFGFDDLASWNQALNIPTLPSTPRTNLFNRYNLQPPKSLVPISVGWEYVYDSNRVVGYRLSSSLTVDGIYIINILDTAGNETAYVVIIDNTEPVVSQSPKWPDADESDVNVVTSPDVAVYFGRNKVVTGASAFSDLVNTAKTAQDAGERLSSVQTLLLRLRNANLIDASNNISIPISEAKISIDNKNFNTIEHGIYDSGDLHYTGIKQTDSYYAELDNEAMYFFRVIDAVGNIGYHYVELNFDEARGVFLEDNEEDIYDTVTGIARTAAVVRNDGVANRKYVSFLFYPKQEPSLEGYTYVVESVTSLFYPMTFEQTYINDDGVEVANPNFPFSMRPRESDEIFRYNSESADARVACGLNYGESGSERGIYIITRKFKSGTFNPYTSKEYKSYFVIVDNNAPIMEEIYVDNEGVREAKFFKSGIEVRFGIPITAQNTATWDNFQKVNNSTMKYERDTNGHGDMVLRGDSVSTQIALPNLSTKYGNNRFYIDYQEYFGNELQSRTVKTFSSLNLVVDTWKRDLASSGNFTNLGDVRNIGSYGSGQYRVGFEDGSGGIGWDLNGNASLRVPVANRSEILVELDISGPIGSFVKNTDTVDPSTYPNIERPSYVSQSTDYVIGSTSFVDGDALRFVFANDSADFRDPIATNPTITRNRNGNIAQLSSSYLMGYQTGTKQTYIYTFNPSDVVAGDIFTVEMRSVGASPRTSVYELYIDNVAPIHNLTRVRADDDFYYPGQEPSNYAYALSNDFVFTYAPVTSSLRVPYFDTHEIYFTEVDATLADKVGAPTVKFSYAALASGTPFAEIVKEYDTTPNVSANRYFRIEERDEAYNNQTGQGRTIYYVQLRDSSYHDSITLGQTVRYGWDTVKTTEMKESTSLINYDGGYKDVYGKSLTVYSANQFFTTNRFFDITIGGTHKRSTEFASTAQFEAFINEQLLNARGNEGGVVSITIDNRFEEPYTFKVYQITDYTAPLDLFKQTNSNFDDVTYELNLISLPQLYVELGVKFEIYDMITHQIVTQFVGSECSFPNESEYLITITDAFGRVKKLEWYGIYGGEIGITYSTASKNVEGEGLFVGDERGVTFYYAREVYNVTYYKDGALYTSGFDVIDDSDPLLRKVSFLPRPDSGTERWEIRAQSKGSGAITIYRFNLYSKLPTVLFVNLSGDSIDEINKEGGSRIVDAVVVAKITIPKDLKFSHYISFSRTYTHDVTGQVVTERRSMGTVTTVTLTLPGTYSFEVSNEIGAKRVYEFIINDVSNTTFALFHRESADNEYKKLRSSPQAYLYQGKQIESFVIMGANSDTQAIGKNADSNSAVYITISPDHKREIKNDLGTTYGYVDQIYHAGSGTTTYIYCLESQSNGAKMYFALTAIPNGTNNANKLMTGIDLSITHSSAPTVAATAADGTYIMYSAMPSPLVIGLTYPNNTTAGQGVNVTYFKYYRNGVYCGTVMGDTLTLRASDHGVYTFEVYDWAGNQKLYKESVGATPAIYQFTIVNLTQAPLLASSRESGERVTSTLESGMVYNDEFTLSLVNLSSYVTVPSHLKDYLYIDKLFVRRNGIVQNITLDKSKNSYSFFESGYYDFEVHFHAGLSQPGNTSLIKKSFFSITLISNPQQSLDFNAGNNEITSVKLNNAEIRQNFKVSNLNRLELSPKIGTGIFEVTVRLDATSVSPVRFHTFKVEIKATPQDFGIIICEDFGKEIKDGSRIITNAYMLYRAYGNCSVLVTLNGEVETRLDVDQYSLLSNYEVVLHAPTKIGKYKVILLNDSENEIWSDGFEIVSGANPMGTIFIIIFLVLLGIGILLFIRLRVGMRVK